MADQKRWFKFWCSALTDDALQSLSPDLRWAWVALGAHTKQHGTRGRVVISPSNAALAGAIGVPVEQLKVTILRLPHVRVEEGKSDNDMFAVTWQNWQQYQEDSTVAERVARLRSKRRGEERRREEKRSTPPLPLTLDSRNGFKSDARDILDFLNRKTGRAYRPVPVNLALIEARLKSGASRDQLQAVIAVKARQWANDPTMAKFLRPATLFNQTKFEQYLGELPIGATP